MSRRILIVSPHFPPINAPDMQRARQCLPYLAARGWEAEVLAVAPEDVAAPQDPLLTASLPPGARVHRVRAWPLRLSRAFGFGSLGLRARGALAHAGDRLLREREFDLVFFTTTQFILMTLGPRWRANRGVPYAVDWQDPWLTDYYARPDAPSPPGGWKYRFAQRQARRHEGPCVLQSAGIVSTSATYLDQLSARYPALASKPAAVIPFGINRDDFVLARRADVAPAFRRQAGVRHAVYVGAVGPIMQRALQVLFAGVKQWLATSSGARASWRLHFIGTSYAPADNARPSVQPLAAAAGVADLVEEQPARVGHFTALRTMLEADALLLLGSDDAGYSPSKIATLAHTGKPVLGLIPGESPLERYLRELDFAHLARFSPLAEVDRVAAFFQALPQGKPVPAGLDAEQRTTELCALFERALGVAKADKQDFRVR
jgi:glycosyltransferase involved in cell wall biosynthesis